MVAVQLTPRTLSRKAWSNIISLCFSKPLHDDSPSISMVGVHAAAGLYNWMAYTCLWAGSSIIFLVLAGVLLRATVSHIELGVIGSDV